MLVRKLATLGALGMIAVGAGGVIFPNESSRGYGIDADDAVALAYVRAAAARDIAIGAVLLRAARRGGKKALRAALAAAALVPLADIAIVATRSADPRKLAIHVTGLAAIATVWALATFGEC